MDRYEITYTYLGSKMTTTVGAYSAESAMKQFALLNKNTIVVGIKQIKGDK